MATDPRLARLAPRTATPPALAPAPALAPSPVTHPPPPQTSKTTSPPAVDGASDGVDSTMQPSTVPSSAKLKFCTVCASNNNRSMEAHLRLSSAPNAYPVISFGTGSLVRLPGPTISQPNVYNFDTTSYNQMYEELFNQDARLYRSNGILTMLDRNRNLKWGPERFQDWVPGRPRLDRQEKGEKGSLGTEGGVVDVIITCEERCWDAVVDNLLDRGAILNRPVHIFNVDIRDNNEEALVGGRAILELADMLNLAAGDETAEKGANGWDSGVGPARRGFEERVPEILSTWQDKWPHLPALWTVGWL